ncbi:hypothetical protein L1887_56630 [Cichorium endivia]|nr:hypothetical protein L1887_56630 [Cichorium endivia]
MNRLVLDHSRHHHDATEALSWLLWRLLSRYAKEPLDHKGAIRVDACSSQPATRTAKAMPLRDQPADPLGSSRRSGSRLVPEEGRGQERGQSNERQAEGSRQAEGIHSPIFEVSTQADPHPGRLLRSGRRHGPNGVQAKGCFGSSVYAEQPAVEPTPAR